MVCTCKGRHVLGSRGEFKQNKDFMANSNLSSEVVTTAAVFLASILPLWSGFRMITPGLVNGCV